MNGIIVFLLAIINGMLINNVTLSRFYGICPFLGVSKKTSSALGMGVAVICVILVAAVICWPIYNYILFPAGIPFMDTITYILVIASLVQLLIIMIKKYAPIEKFFFDGCIKFKAFQKFLSFQPLYRRS